MQQWHGLQVLEVVCLSSLGLDGSDLIQITEYSQIGNDQHSLACALLAGTTHQSSPPLWLMEGVRLANRKHVSAPTVASTNARESWTWIMHGGDAALGVILRPIFLPDGLFNSPEQPHRERERERGLRMRVSGSIPQAGPKCC